MQTVHIIIVEDEPAILQGVAGLIRKLPLPLSITGLYANGWEALEDLDRSRPDICIADVQMPVMSGLELIDRMKELRCQTEYLILSGYAEFSYVQAALKLNVRQYLLKPPRIRELREALEILCKKIQQDRYEAACQELWNLIFSPYQSLSPDSLPPCVPYRLCLALFGPFLDEHFEVLKGCPQASDLKEALEPRFPGLYVLNGSAPNWKVLIIPKDSSVSSLYELLRAQAKTLTLTLAVGRTKDRWEDLTPSVNCGLLTLKKTVSFSDSQVVSFSQNSAWPVDFFTKEERKLVDKAIASRRPEALSKQARYLALHWKEQRFSQAQFTALAGRLLEEISRQALSPQASFAQRLALVTAQSRGPEDFIASFLSLVEEAARNLAPEGADSSVEYVAGLLWNYILENYSGTLDIPSFAKSHGYHPVYLITQFSKLKNISPTQLIIQLRMDRAKELLRSSAMSLREISDAVGYPDVSYFSRIFKEREGVSPGTWRKNP